MNNYHDDSCNEPIEQVVIISINGVENEFFGDALTSPLHDAILFLQEQQQNEMVV